LETPAEVEVLNRAAMTMQFFIVLGVAATLSHLVGVLQLELPLEAGFSDLFIQTYFYSGHNSSMDP
jgi:hypothetical protein